MSQLRTGSHNNAKLLNVYRRYGFEAFRFDVLEYVSDHSLLIEREQFWIDQTLPFYNIARVAGSTLGCVMSEETKRKIGDANRGRTREFSEEHRAAISAATIGTTKPHLSDERKKQISESMKGRKFSDETRERLSRAGIGRTHSDESRKKISEAKCVYQYEVVSPIGETYTVSSIRGFCAEHIELHSCAMLRVAHGKQPAHKGWKVRILEVL